MSIVDDVMAAGGSIVELSSGIQIAQAGDRKWHREYLESEEKFLNRVRAEAFACGIHTVAVRGFVSV